MQHINNNNSETPTAYSELLTSAGKWHYNSSISREFILKEFPEPDTIGHSKKTDFDKVLSGNDLSHYILKISPAEQYHFRHYHTYLINRFKSIVKKSSSSQVKSLGWLAVTRNYNIPSLELVAWSCAADGNIVVTRSKSDLSNFSDYLNRYRPAIELARYRDDIPEEMAAILRSAGKLAGKMHRSGLLLNAFSASALVVLESELEVSIFDLETMARCTVADSHNIFCDTLSYNLANLAADILIATGPAGLAIFIESYLDTTLANQQQYQSFYNHIHTLAQYQQGKRFHTVDKISMQDNECFQRLNLSDNFKARVFLKSNKPHDFSPACSMTFTVEQWKNVLEPLILSKKLFTRKELILNLPDRDINVCIEGGPGKVITAKWQMGHCHINRNIDTPLPLALITYKRQAVLITEKRSDNIPRNYCNILIVKPSALGDIARAIPVLNALREKYPKSRISWLIRPEYADLIKYHPALDEIILFDKKKFNRLNLDCLRRMKHYSKLLFDRRFDLVLDMQGLLRTGLITRFTKAPCLIGYKRAREFAWLFYSKKVQTPEINHSNDDCWRIAIAAGINADRPGFGVPVDRNSRVNARIILSRNAIAENDDYISILPGGTADEKIWNPQNYGKLAKEIYKKYNIRSVVIGYGKREAELADTICQIAGSEIAINLVNQSSISEMTEIIANSLMAIGNDSGPLHIAAAIPKTVIGLYGPTNPKAVGPVGQLENVIEAGQDIKRFGRYSKDRRHKINNITVEQVLEKFSELYASRTKLTTDT